VRSFSLRGVQPDRELAVAALVWSHPIESFLFSRLNLVPASGNTFPPMFWRVSYFFTGLHPNLPAIMGRVRG
jgi:hypothetical protein